MCVVTAEFPADAINIPFHFNEIVFWVCGGNCPPTWLGYVYSCALTIISVLHLLVCLSRVINLQCEEGDSSSTLSHSVLLCGPSTGHCKKMARLVQQVLKVLSSWCLQVCILLC